MAMMCRKRRRLVLRDVPTLLTLYKDAFFSITEFLAVEQICRSKGVSRAAKVLFGISLEHKKIVKTNSGSCSVVLQNCKDIRKLLVISLETSSMITLLGILKSHKNLTKLIFDKCPLTPEIITAVTRLSNLQELLVFGRSRITTAVHRLPALRTLAVWASHADQFAGSLPNLEFLRLLYLTVPENCFRNISIQCTRLSALNLSFSTCSFTRFQELQYLTGLTDLHINFICLVDVSAIQWLKRLESLSLSFLKTPNSAKNTDDVVRGLEKVGRYCGELTFVRFVFQGLALGKDMTNFFRKCRARDVFLDCKKPIVSLVQANVVVETLRMLSFGIWEETCGVVRKFAPNVRFVSCWLKDGENSEKCFESFTGWVVYSAKNPDKKQFGAFSGATFYVLFK